MNLRKFYKNEIKTVAANLKIAKPASRKLESFCARGLGDSQEAASLRQTLTSLPSIWSMREKSRYLNLAYAVIRNKDLAKVETNPKIPHDPKILQRIKDQMVKDFEKLQAEEPLKVVTHE